VPGDADGATATGRQSWFGAKRYVKSMIARPVPHAVLRAAIRLLPRLRSPRLPAPAGLHRVEGRVGATRFVMLRPDRCEIAKELYWGHGQRPRPEDAYALRLIEQRMRDADVFLDVGAYTGIFSLVAALAGGSADVHAFEIVPAVVDLLRENVRANGLTDRVRVRPEGIGDPDTEMMLPSGEGGSALPSFYSSRMRFPGATVRVPFRSLDSVAADLPAGARVVMKIDVEGTEDAVFASGQRFLHDLRPDMLCEVLAGVADPARLEALLSPHGYRYHLVTEDRLVPHGHIRPSTRFKDWFLTTAPLASE
jgi:FkbM family methyltransferase